MNEVDPDIVIDILARIAADRVAGRNPSIAEYRVQFPAHGEFLARVLARTEPDGGDNPTATQDDGDIGPYRIVRLLGRGAQGAVYLVDDKRLPRRCALKVLEIDGRGPDALARFQKEAAAVARIDHPSIAPIIESGRDRNRVWIALRYVEGETLARKIENSKAASKRFCELGGERTNSIESLLRFFATVARAAHAAHTSGVVHRDLKPANIMVDSRGDPVILDFGVARELSRDVATLTSIGEFVGTPAYLAPETIAGSRAGVAADVWAIGATIFETILLRRPFDAPTPARLLAAIADDEPAGMSELARIASRDAAAVVATALEKDPNRRYLSADLLADDLEAIVEHRSVRARPASTLRRLFRLARRNPIASLAAAAACVIVVATVGFLIAYSAQERRMRKEVEDRHRRFTQAADTLRLVALAKEESLLLPSGPTLIRPCEDWIARADELIGRSQTHESVLDAIRGRLGDLSVPRTGVDEEDRWLAEILVELLAARDHVRRLRGTMVERLNRSREFARRIVEDDAERWKRCIAAVAASKKYGGLTMVPQPGLQPIAADDESGLWEFLHLESGGLPLRDDNGRFVMAAESGIILVLVPATRAVTGAHPADSRHPDQLAEMDEHPVFEVELEPYFLAKHEMTQAQWVRLGGVNASTYRADAVFFRQQIRATNPVENVTWPVAKEILRRTGLVLPTEAQWENACRSGTLTRWSTGDDVTSLKRFANLRGDEVGRAAMDREEGWIDPFVVHAPVGSLEPNAFGFHDMHGNVYEWCADQYAPYTEGKPVGDGGERLPENPRGRSTRGGGWTRSAAFCRSADRNPAPEETAVADLGVRAARRLEKK